jgi:peptide deformylase
MIRPQSGGSITTFINPEIITYSQALQSPKKKGGIYEGCLSLPGHYSPVTRSLSVTVKYQKLDARLYTPTPVQETFSGFAAHIIQHEADHLNGILFIDRVLEQNIPLYKIEGNTWTEISL